MSLCSCGTNFHKVRPPPLSSDYIDSYTGIGGLISNIAASDEQRAREQRMQLMPLPLECSRVLYEWPLCNPSTSSLLWCRQRMGFLPFWPPSYHPLEVINNLFEVIWWLSLSLSSLFYPLECFCVLNFLSFSPYTCMIISCVLTLFVLLLSLFSFLQI